MTIGTRIILKDRKPLETLLPLEAPLVLFIDPSDACCLKCNFCPTGNNILMKETNRPLKQMSFSLYKKIIDDLEEFETKVKVIRLYGHGEPLLNKDFCDMVKYAKESKKVEMVDTTTNGIMLTPVLNYKLIESGIDRINISVNGLTDNQYLNFTNTKVNFKEYVKNILHLFNIRKETYLFIKINGDTISEKEEQMFLDIFEPIADSVAIEKSMNCWSGFEPKGFIRKDNNVGIYGQQIDDEALVCPYVMYSMMINSNGKVSACFLDWNLKLNYDDVNNSSVYNIWHGNKANSLRKIMLEGKRKSLPVCKDCEQLVKGMPSNIDKYSDELIKKYNF
jgi:MoaA/NifB/PqqE/SkfB family radical SAM enzyme